MNRKVVANGVVHEVPADLCEALAYDPKAFAVWEDLTPLARNEWICWVTFVKREDTRKDHIKRLVNELKQGKRRPCCWIGCIHRKDKQISPSVQWALSRQSKKTT